MASMRHRLLGAPWTGTFSITNADGASANKILSVLSSGARTVQMNAAGPATMAGALGIGVPVGLEFLGCYVKSQKTVHGAAVTWSVRNVVAWAGHDLAHMHSLAYPGGGHFPIWVVASGIPAGSSGGLSSFASAHGPCQDTDILNTVRESAFYFAANPSHPSIGPYGYVAFALFLTGPAVAVTATSTWTLEIQFFGR